MTIQTLLNQLNLSEFGSITLNRKTINTFVSKAETVFNLAASMPFLGLVSGPLRQEAGKAQFIAASIIVVAGLVTFNEAWFDFGKEHVVHGLMNIFRGYVDTVWGISTLLLVAQANQAILGGAGFKPQVSYKT